MKLRGDVTFGKRNWRLGVSRENLVRWESSRTPAVFKDFVTGLSHTQLRLTHTLTHTLSLTAAYSTFWPGTPRRCSRYGRSALLSHVACRAALLSVLLCCVISTQRVACAHTALSPPLTCCVALVCSRLFHLYSKRKTTLKQKKRQCLTFTRRHSLEGVLLLFMPEYVFM